MFIRRVLFVLIPLLIPTASISAPAADYNPYQYSEPLIIEKVEPQKDPEPSWELLCNCWAYTRSLVSGLPDTATIRANLSQEITDVAVFYYPNAGLYHYAKVTTTDGYNFTIDEANYHHCKVSQRTLSTDYPFLLGFYKVN